MKTTGRHSAGRHSANLPVYDLTSHTAFVLQTNGIALVPFEPLRQATNRLSKPHRHDFHAFQLFTEGEGHHLIDGKSYPISPGCLFYISPGQVHSWQSAVPLRGYALMFTTTYWAEFGPLASELNQTGIFPKPGSFCWQLAGEDYQSVRTVLEHIYEEMQEQRPGKLVLLKTYLLSLLIQLERLTPDPAASATQSATHQLVSAYQQLVLESGGQYQMVSFYADQLGITPDYLNTLTRVYLGRKASSVIHEQVVIEALRLLQYTPLDIAEIAYQLRFREPGQFTKFIRRYTGQTPTQHRSGFAP